MHSKIKIYIVVSAYILVLSCTSNESKKQNKENETPVNEIVLIVRGAPETNRIQNKFGSGTLGRGTGIIRWFEDNLITQEYAPQVYPAFDTIIINTEQENFELVHTYRGLDEISFFFEKGDSVILNYLDSIPTATVLNRKTYPADLSYEIIKRNVVCNGGYPANMRSTVLPTLFARTPEQSKFMSTNSPSILLNFEKNIFTQHEAEKIKERKLLDSLLEHRQLSVKVYELYIQKLKFSDYEIIFYPADSVKSILQQDSLLFYNFYRKYLSKLLSNKSISPSIPKIRTANGFFADARIGYDSLVLNKNFSGQTRDYLLFNKVNAIIRDFSSQDISAYMNKFEKDVADTSMSNHLRRKYNIGVTLDKELRLVGLTGESVTLNQILSKFKGKVIYIDFWASWCAPCIRAFPDAKLLREQYKNKDVVFLLLSIDEDSKKWEKAVERYELGCDDNYLIKNNHSSKFLDDIKLSSIPRYLLIGKDGRIINTSALAPGNPTIKVILNAALRD